MYLNTIYFFVKFSKKKTTRRTINKAQAKDDTNVNFGEIDTSFDNKLI